MLNAGVNASVPIKRFFGGELGVAHLTFVGPFAGMLSAVLLEGAAGRESHFAEIARVRLIT